MVKNIVYGGANDYPEPSEAETLRFMQLSPKDLANIESTVMNLARRAAEDRYFFFFSNYHVREHIESGEKEVIVLDTTPLSIIRLRSFPFEQVNIEQVEKFMLELKQILEISPDSSSISEFG